jgi:UMF1 family MFS transporter
MPVNDRREIFGWSMYDWANSGFQCTVITVMSGPYLTALAQNDVGENGVVFRAGALAVTAKSLFPFCIGLSVFLQVLLLPILGAIADYTSLKKALLAAFCYTGSVAAFLLFFVTGDRYLAGGALIVVGNLCFGAALVVYNAFLNEIASEDQRDRVSSRGYALGYLGGGVLLLLNLALVQNADALGLNAGLAVRISLASAGVWWGGFAIVTFRRLHERPRPAPPTGEALLAVGVREVVASFRALARLPHTARYLTAYMLFNDGIQTVIAMASLFLSQELFVARGLPEDQSFLISLILMIQFVAFFGARLFEGAAGLVGAKAAILASLVIWSGTLVYAYGWLRTTTQAWLLGAAIAMVLGGSQALSRSLFSRMIPPNREASFFGIYEIAERGTSWIGPVIFGIVVAATNSYRQAMLSLIVLFLAGMVLLLLTDTRQAIRDAAGRYASVG